MPKIHVNNINMYYEVKGEGEPLLFIGGLGSNSHNWEYQIEVFSKNYKVITFDLRGHGESDKPKGPYNMSLFAKDVFELIKSLNYFPVHVVGLSMGASIGFQLAIDYPDIVKTLTAVNMAASFSKKRYYVFLIGVKLLGVKKFAKFITPRLFINTEHKELSTTWMKRFAMNDKEALLHSLKALKNWNIRNQLYKINCPTLMICSERDQTPLKLKEECVNLIPNAKLMVINDAGHVVSLEKPKEFNEMLGEFLLKSH